MNPEDLPAGECRAIVAEMAEMFLAQDDPRDLTEKFYDRILALAPKPGPWPMVFEQSGGRPPVGADISEHGSLKLFNPRHRASAAWGWWDDAIWLEESVTDKLVVAWLAHRGVDLPLVRDIVGGWEISNEAAGALGPRPQHDALRAILDNAGRD